MALFPVTSRSTFRKVFGGNTVSGPVVSATSYGQITVTPELALTLTGVWACVWRYANVISTLPLKLMKTGPKNTATVYGDHPLYTILHDRPNAQMSAAKFWQAMVASMMTWGACYAEKQRIGSRLVGLKPLRPEYMTTYMDDAGKLRYRYWPSGSSAEAYTEYSADDLFVVLDRSMDGYTGLSRVEYGANAFGLAMAGDRTASLSYKNGLRASGILTVATWLKKEQRDAYRDMVNEYAGTGSGATTDKQYGIFVAENATKFESLSMKPADVELLASRKFAIEEICRWYDVPPILIGHSMEGQTMWGSGIEQIMLGWQKLGLAPVLRTIEQEIWRQLLTTEEQGQGVFAEYNLEALLRGDSTARAAFYSSMASNAILTRDEIRAKENLPPMPGGDVLTVQSAMINLAQLDGPEEDDQ
jgi:HK97 family phage portal protein